MHIFAKHDLLNWMELNGMDLNWIELNWYDMIGKGRHLYMHVLAM
jgi:hypothetical protein